MKRRLVAVSLVVMVGVTACDSAEPEAVPEPETVEDCDGLVDVGAQLVRAYIRVLEATRIDDFTAEEPPPEFLELQRIGVDLDARVERLGCDPTELNALIDEELGEVETDSPSARMLLEIVEDGLVSSPPAADPTAPPDTGVATTVDP